MSYFYTNLYFTEGELLLKICFFSFYQLFVHKFCSFSISRFIFSCMVFKILYIKYIHPCSISGFLYALNFIFSVF